MVRRGSYANDLETIFDGSLRMGSNARGLSSPGSLNIFLRSIQRKHWLEHNYTLASSPCHSVLTTTRHRLLPPPLV